jgi:hypothetical protein
MSKPPNNVRELSKTLTLCEYTDPKNGGFGFWLYDSTRKMNLSMRAKTAEAALLEALDYYQQRLLKVEAKLYTITTKVDAFVEQFKEEEWP